MKIRKISFLTLLLFAILLLPNVVNAAVGDVVTIDGIKYTVLTEQENNYTVEVSGYEGALTTATIPQTITNSSKTYTVTEIGYNAFINCSSLINIILPDSVVSIGQGAFYQCNSLENIALSANLKSIGIQAFFNCNSLKSITLPDGITTINMSAFSHCSSLETVTIPNSITSIGNSVFVSCSSLKSITLPDGLTSIPSMLFSVCSSLETVIIPSSVTSIGSWAFDRCTSLTNITIPDNITTIAKGAFSGCTALKTVTIPSSVTIIDDDVFINCDLVTLTIEGYPGSVIKDYADFYDIEFKPIYKVTNKLTNITIANESFENDYKATIRADAGFILPQNILVRVGSIDLASNEYTYNSTNGELMVPEKLIVGDIEIEAVGEKIHKITFDANGGEFSGGDNILYFNDAKEFNFDKLETPIKSGYKFIGYYTEKTGGTSLENIMNSEAGIEDDIIFYARWEEIPKQENVTKEEPSKELDESPKMGNDNRNFASEITLLSICFVTVISFSVYNKKSSK